MLRKWTPTRDGQCFKTRNKHITRTGAPFRLGFPYRRLIVNGGDEGTCVMHALVVIISTCLQLTVMAPFEI